MKIKLKMTKCAICQQKFNRTRTNRTKKCDDCHSQLAAQKALTTPPLANELQVVPQNHHRVQSPPLGLTVDQQTAAAISYFSLPAPKGVNKRQIRFPDGTVVEQTYQVSEGVWKLVDSVWDWWSGKGKEDGIAVTETVIKVG